MKKTNIGLTILALLVGVGTVVASNNQKLTTTYTNGQGVSETKTWVDTNCSTGPILCANVYQDGVQNTDLTRFKLQD